MIKIATTQLWVHDQDEALDFWTNKVGLEVRTDVTVPEMGNFRWLTVGPAGQPDISIVLMAIPGAPMIDAGHQRPDPRADGRRASPGPCSSSTDDCRASFAELRVAASSSPRSRSTPPTASTPGSATRPATASA